MNYLHHDDDTNRILIASENGVKEEAFRTLPGTRWLPAQRMWSCPATPMVASRIVELASTKGLKTDPTKSFVKLLEKAESLQTEQAKVVEADQLPFPPIRKYDPWKHQNRAYHFAYPMPAVMLAMDMGTGKTKVVYDLVQNTPWIQTVLVACPKSAIRDVWWDQFDEHWAREDGSILALDEGTQLQRANRAYEYLCSDEKGPRIIIVNYDILWQPTFGDFALSVDWGAVILDESHRVRSAGGKTSKYVFRLGERAQKRMCLSGTPMANSPLDVYGQYRFLDAGIFGTNKQRFLDEFAIFGGFRNYEVRFNEAKTEELNRRFYSIAFYVPDSVLDLPPRHTIQRKGSLESKARKLYNELDKEFTADVSGGSVTFDNVLVKALRLSQLTSGYLQLDDVNGKRGPLQEVSGAKRELLEDTLCDLARREPLVIFARFHPDLDLIRRVCEKSGRSVGELSGRENDLAAWKRGELDVLAVQIQAGSESIDLTRASYAIYYSIGFDLYIYKQSLKRIHRPKQKRPVTLIHLLVRNSIDIEIMAAIRKNQNIIDYVMNLRKAA